MSARRFCTGAAALLLAACASVPAPIAPTPTTDAGAFSLEGRIAVRYGAENLSGRIAWTHELARDEIGLASPLGNQVARLVRDGSGVTLTDAERQSFRAADAESLTEQRLGWRLPLDGLADWVRGRVRADRPHEARRDSAGRLDFLAQSDWRIDYAYEDGAPLPRRLFMQYARAAEPLEIRLVIDRWQ